MIRAGAVQVNERKNIDANDANDEGFLLILEKSEGKNLTLIHEAIVCNSFFESKENK